jgi:hypothetical protein
MSAKMCCMIQPSMKYQILVFILSLFKSPLSLLLVSQRQCQPITMTQTPCPVTWHFYQ